MTDIDLAMFQCSHCDKSYQRKTHLLRHEATRKMQEDHARF